MSTHSTTEGLNGVSGDQIPVIGTMFPHNQGYNNHQQQQQQQQQRQQQQKQASEPNPSQKYVKIETTKNQTSPHNATLSSPNTDPKTQQQSYTHFPKANSNSDIDNGFDLGIHQSTTAEHSHDDGHEEVKSPSMKIPVNDSDDVFCPIMTTNNNMNSKINKKLGRIPVNLGPKGITPSGKPRLFQCEVCMRAFARQEHLKRHERSHTKEKPFLCGVCQRRFSRRDLLLRHAQKLHAGNDEAVKRIRRKSLRSKIGQGAMNNSVDNEWIEEEQSKKLKSDTSGLYQAAATSISQTRTNGSTSLPLNDGIPFTAQQYQPPVPTYQQLQSQSQLLMNSQGSSDMFSTGHPNGPLNQTSDRFRSGSFQGQQQRSGNEELVLNSVSNNNFTPISSNRRMSFSALSGTSYGSLAQPQRNNYYADTVEFATPQLGPVGLSETENIENMSLSTFANGVEQVSGNNSNNNYQSLRHHQQPTNQQQQQINPNSSAAVNNQKPPNSTNLNPNSFWLHEGNNTPNTNSYEFLNNFHLNEAQRPTVHTDLSNNFENFTLQDIKTKEANRETTGKKRKYNRKTQGVKKPTEIKKANVVDDIFGYSFYDDDFLTGNQNIQYHQQQFNNLEKLSLPKVPTDFHQGESNTNTTSNSATNLNEGWSIGSSQEFDVNDFDLLNDLEVPNIEEKILSVGYSFYESNDFASNTKEHTTGTVVTNEGNNSTTMKNSNNDGSLFKNSNILDYPKSKEFLFSDKFVHVIRSVLQDYPFVGLGSPDFPSVDQLNFFVSRFQEKFLPHYPFIHRNFFNEAAMFQYTKMDSYSTESSAFVCLPLLIVTIGSLYSNQRQVSSDLYELSRRCIHVYLDSRKKSDKAEKSTTRNSPLWLVQSLVLSILYGLFVDCDEADSSIVIKQVSALCTLTKVSKLHLIEFHQESIQFDEQYFNDYVVYQSKLRTVYTIFNISSLLTSMYNLKPLLLYSEIKCDLPDLENYWNSLDIYQLRDQVTANSNTVYSLKLDKIINDIVVGNAQPYKVSEFGSTVVLYTLYQYFFLHSHKGMDEHQDHILWANDTFNLLNDNHENLSRVLRNLRWDQMLLNFEELNLDSMILKNSLMIISMEFIPDSMKDSVWNKNYTKFNAEFLNLKPTDDQLINGLDYSLRNIHLLFFGNNSSSNFYKTQSLHLQFFFYNFIIVVKFLHELEYSQEKSSHFFPVYLRVVKLFKELESILISNLDMNPNGPFYPFKNILFGRHFNLFELLNAPEGKSLDPQGKYRIVCSFKLSLKFLKIGEFFFDILYGKMLNFKIFKSLETCLTGLRTVLNELENRRGNSGTNIMNMTATNEKTNSVM